MPQPGQFPPLPDAQAGAQPWSRDVQQAFGIIAGHYSSAVRLLREEDTNYSRLRYHSDRLTNETVPLLDALHTEVASEQWIVSACEALGQLVIQLVQAECDANAKHVLYCCIYATDIDLSCVVFSDRTRTARPDLVQTEQTGAPGRPKKVVDVLWLANAVAPNRRITQKRLAQILGIHRNTLRARLKEKGLAPKFITLTDRELEIIVKMFKIYKPESGLRYLVGFLRQQNARVQRKRVQQMLRASAS